MSSRKQLLMPKDLFKQCKFDMKKTWDVLSDILNRDIRNSVPDNMIINGLECSVLPVLSKVFETVIYEQLSDYFSSNNL